MSRPHMSVSPAQMSRLAVVSNRVPGPNGGCGAGGLVTALEPVLAERGGVWLGWSGSTARPGAMATRPGAEGFALATLDLSEAEVEGYYNRLANRALWPALHSRLDLVRIDHAAYATYLAVNRRFALALSRLLHSDDAIWVQDYHLIPLGHELRKLGVRAPIGFFLHTPFPPPQAFAALPWAPELARQLTAYDLVGLQTGACAENFRAYLRRFAPGRMTSDGAHLSEGHTVRIEAHPIGIDARRHAELAASPEVTSRVGEIRRRLGGRVGIAGVDRLDYSKGLAQRFQALGALLERHPELVDRLTLCQIGAPSRQSVPEYRALRSDVAAQAGRVNARFGTFGWMPVHYVHRSFGCAEVAALMRACRVGLVTPLRDGMNLVAKEYVAAQDPADPGVLVLSRFAGAAEQLTDALIVNPYDTGATAEALHGALRMPLAERIGRWRSLMRNVEAQDVHRWQRDFLAALAAAHRHAPAYTSSAA